MQLINSGNIHQKRRFARSQSLIERYGSVALITGASSGIGKELAVQLAEKGFDLILVARNEESLLSLAADLTAADKGESKRRIDVVAADLGTKEGVTAVLRACHEREIGLLAASAGFGTAGNFVDSDIGTEID